MRLPNGHDHSCDPSRNGISCVYWCEIGGLLKPLRECVEKLEQIGGNPGKAVAAAGRAALERWSR